MVLERSMKLGQGLRALDEAWPSALQYRLSPTARKVCLYEETEKAATVDSQRLTWFAACRTKHLRRPVRFAA
jgi:hypothetical protein